MRERQEKLGGGPIKPVPNQGNGEKPTGWRGVNAPETKPTFGQPAQ